MTLRQSVIDYIKDSYGTSIEYLWMRFPSYGITYSGVIAALSRRNSRTVTEF